MLPKKVIDPTVALTNNIELMNGAHIIYIYTDEDFYLENAISFIASGLDLAHGILFLESREKYNVILKRLLEKGYDEKQFEAITFVDSQEFYLDSNNHFRFNSVLNNFSNAMKALMNKGIPIRTWGSGVLTKQDDLLNELIQYELNSDVFIKNNHCFSIIAHNANTLPVNFLIELMKYHPYIMTDTELFVSSLYNKSRNVPAIFIDANLEEALKTSEARVQTFIDRACIGISFEDKHGKILQCNKKFADVLGYSKEELCKMKFTDYVHPDELENDDFYKQLINGKLDHYEVERRCLCKDGRTIWAKLNVFTDKERELIFTTIEDITAYKKYKQEIARLDRLHIVGQMAASISHEVRNPMTTVRGLLQLLSSKKEYQQETEIINLMISELDRANSIINEFLDIGRDCPAELEIQNLNEIIETMEPLLQADAMNANHYIEFKLGNIPKLSLNSKEIRQIILNLVRNGIEAMESKGKITISTRYEAGTVILEVKDQGPGIDKEVLDKVGTPFFTTKDTGTGLGLATCYSIIERHHGNIEIDTSGDGTTFRIFFKPI